MEKLVLFLTGLITGGVIGSASALYLSLRQHPGPTRQDLRDELPPWPDPPDRQDSYKAPEDPQEKP
jgi:gas vesicle protein